MGRWRAGWGWCRSCGAAQVASGSGQLQQQQHCQHCLGASTAGTRARPGTPQCLPEPEGTVGGGLGPPPPVSQTCVESPWHWARRPWGEAVECAAPALARRAHPAHLQQLRSHSQLPQAVEHQQRAQRSGLQKSLGAGRGAAGSPDRRDAWQRLRGRRRRGTGGPVGPEGTGAATRGAWRTTGGGTPRAWRAVGGRRGSACGPAGTAAGETRGGHSLSGQERRRRSTHNVVHKEHYQCNTHLPTEACQPTRN